MYSILKIISWIGLGLTVLPAAFFFFGAMSLDTVKTSMTVGMILWFAGAIIASKFKTSSAE